MPVGLGRGDSIVISWTISSPSISCGEGANIELELLRSPCEQYSSASNDNDMQLVSSLPHHLVQFQVAAVSFLDRFGGVHSGLVDFFFMTSAIHNDFRFFTQLRYQTTIYNSL